MLAEVFKQIGVFFWKSAGRRVSTFCKSDINFNLFSLQRINLKHLSESFCMATAWSLPGTKSGSYSQQEPRKPFLVQSHYFIKFWLWKWNLNSKKHENRGCWSKRVRWSRSIRQGSGTRGITSFKSCPSFSLKISLQLSCLQQEKFHKLQNQPHYHVTHRKVRFLA